MIAGEAGYEHPPSATHTGARASRTNLLGGALGFTRQEFFELEEDSADTLVHRSGSERTGGSAHWRVRGHGRMRRREGLEACGPPRRATRGAARLREDAGRPLGARVGGEILRRRGGAVDAAVATAFAMAVVEPFMSCLAGGGSMLIHRPRTGASVALDFNVEAPQRAARRDVPARGAGGAAISSRGGPWRATRTCTARAVAVPVTALWRSRSGGRWSLPRRSRPRRRGSRASECRWTGLSRASPRCMREEGAGFPGAAEDLCSRRPVDRRTPGEPRGGSASATPALASASSDREGGPSVFSRGELAKASGGGGSRRGQGILVGAAWGRGATQR